MMESRSERSEVLSPPHCRANSNEYTVSSTAQQEPKLGKLIVRLAMLDDHPKGWDVHRPSLSDDVRPYLPYYQIIQAPGDLAFPTTDYCQ